MQDFVIYMHTSPSRKVYVGITCQKLERRWRNGNGYKNNEYFNRAIKKYGWDNFSHSIIADGLTMEEAEQIEMALIADLKSDDPRYGYNISGGGSGPKHVSESTRKKISEANKGKHSGADNYMFGRHHTPDARRKMSEKTKGLFIGEKSPLYGKHPSEETRAKMSKSRKESPVVQEHMQKMNAAKRKKVLCVETGVIYESVKAAGRGVGHSPANIATACRGEYEQAYGYHWRYV